MGNLSRRQFLNMAGASVGSTIIGGCASKATPFKSSPPFTPARGSTAVAAPTHTPIDLANRYIAYCGLDCANLCSQFQSKICPGCLSPNCAAYCTSCEVRFCNQERGIANCAHCEEYPCRKLEDLYAIGWGSALADYSEEAKAALEQVRRSAK